MTAETFINHTLPRVSPEDVVADVLELMAETLHPELPLVSEGRFAGVLREAALAGIPSDDMAVGQLPVFAAAAFVQEGQHYLDVLRIAADAQSQIVAVLDEHGAYQGAITTVDLIQRMGQGLALQLPGGILVLSVNERDYSLAEISRLVESNEAKVLTSYIESDPEDYQRLRVMLRINQTDLSRIIATLERFGYLVSASYHQAEAKSLDEERLGSLLRFLDI